MWASTSDADEWVERVATPYTAWQNNGMIESEWFLPMETLAMHPYVLRVSKEIRALSHASNHMFDAFCEIMAERAIKKRIALILKCFDVDVCKLVHEFLGVDVFEGDRGTFQHLVHPSGYVFQAKCNHCIKKTLFHHTGIVKYEVVKLYVCVVCKNVY